MAEDFNIDELFKAMGVRGMPGKEYDQLYKTHPHFDSYPDYMKTALLGNERLQGRIK